MAALEQALAKLRAATHFHAIPLAISADEALEIIDEVERLQRQLEEAQEREVRAVSTHASDSTNRTAMLDAERETVVQLRQALERVRENARAWHGPQPDMGHVRALAVIATWCDAALEGPAPATEPPLRVAKATMERVVGSVEEILTAPREGTLAKAAPATDGAAPVCICGGVRGGIVSDAGDLVDTGAGRCICGLSPAATGGDGEPCRCVYPDKCFCKKPAGSTAEGAG